MCEYVMSKEMYKNLLKSMKNKGKNATKDDVIAYVNQTFGLKEKVTNLVIE